MLLLLEADGELMLHRKLRRNNHDVRLVPSRATAGGYEIQQGGDGREHLSGYMECGEEY